MGKQSRKSKKVGSKSTDDVNLKQNKHDDGNNIKIYDNDTAVFISMAQELKEEGNKLFQTKCYEAAILKYQKALKLLPENHLDVSYLHSNIAACYMQMGITDFPRAIHECNLALEVTPKYSKALLKRARCYEALNRLDLALRDVNVVLDIEPNNLMATEILERVRSRMADKLTEGKVNECQQEIGSSQIPDPSKEKAHKKKKNKSDKKSEKLDQVSTELKDYEKDEKKTEDKLVVKEKINVSNIKEEEPKRVVKLVYGEDIRWAKIPFDCDILKVREIVSDRFPVSKAVLIKYKDEEGDMVTITTNEELKWAESSTSDQRGALRLYIVEVNPEQDPFFDHIRNREKRQKLLNSSACIDDWILEFAQLFKNYVGFNTDSYWDLHQLGMKLYSEAMEETVTSDEAQEFFHLAADNFQEMVALAYFNWGNVHMSRARKRVYDSENGSRESILLQIKDSYEWTQMEYLKAGERYEEAIKIKPDFYEGFLALGQQRFEQAKLSWYYAVGTKTNLETWDSTETVRLYNEAEDNMEKGIKIWEEIEMKRVGEVLRPNKVKLELQKTELGKYVKDFTQDEMAELAENMRSRVNVLWGTMFYERSMMEYKLGIPVWRECLEIAVEKFELAGASRTHIAVMIKNHCSNDAAPEGVGFNIDEIVQAWNDMFDAKMWQIGVPSFVLEPLLQRRVPKIFHTLKHA
ncbi:putative PB1 domain, tetratricopeptide-like helical domain superfamily [Helianthus annuus]|uniref:PB1 domain, tetratricopeptide-like helical domain superfamily n=1 Tax=Helianthus annuus TaxID=4232 RepID=A0A251URV0_HELAN|nr:protein PHOX1 [Helianthus annuus]KAF5805133.1 putative PB1 domain, tetratricopeptide-like helical domain superfamily [Helianthus annuus]KAJ0918219.1 putative PB1 domain, tetratricopeptide-like helical domain superfamily [Helianthus annuus]KAJ0921999.1 putative PB1 domain, tetratricopeptide-like helical domain superfamily [Helianthus annuus]